MKIHVLSDLHLELSSWELPEVEADVTVFAGDIHSHTHALSWIEKFVRGPAIYIPGNHEFYGAELHGIRAELKRRTIPQIHVLDNTSIELDGVRFLGCTLWTDYMLYGAGDEMAHAMREAKRSLIDHEAIRCAPRSLFSPTHAQELHRESVAWLTAQLTVETNKKTVVVTHHLPSMQSVAERFKTHPLSAAFASNMDSLVERADLWIHGHTHDNFDYRLGKCRVVCNPRGYVWQRDDLIKAENSKFDPELVIEL